MRNITSHTYTYLSWVFLMDKKAHLLGTLHLCTISQRCMRLYKCCLATRKLQLPQSLTCGFQAAVPWSVVTTFSKLWRDSTTNLWTKVKSLCQTDTNWQYNQSGLSLLVNSFHVSWNNPMIPPGKQVMCLHIGVAFRGVDAGAVPLAVQPNPGNFREHPTPDCDWGAAEAAGAFTLTKLWSKL